MKILFYLPSPLYEPHFGVLFDEAERLRREGNKIHIIICNGFFDVCVTNSSGDSAVCRSCISQTHKFVNKFSNNFYIHNIKDYSDNSIKYKKFNYNSVSDIKKIEYRGAKIGFASLSTYISETRNLNPLVDDKFKFYFDDLLLQSCVLTNAINNAIDDIKPDLVCLFNGRFFDSRPIFDVARQKNIDTTSYDASGDANKIYVMQIFHNVTPHNIENNTFYINHYWDDPVVKIEDKIDIARDFFQKKRDHIFTSDVVYTKRQQNGILPANFDEKMRNIVIFNSSEDEYVAVGDEYDKLALFESQLEGLKYIFETYKNNKEIHFYLRIHPNLTGIKYKYHTDLYLFQKKYNNVTVIGADDKISSYSLLDVAEKVIVFGSTIGVEASYWGKAVILMSGAPYYYLDICYKPKTLLELVAMIEQKLEPKEKIDALKFAYYSMYKDPNKTFRYIDFTTHFINLFGRKIYVVNYKKILGSPSLFAICRIIKREFLKIFSKKKFKNIPSAEL